VGNKARIYSVPFTISQKASGEQQGISLKI